VEPSAPRLSVVIPCFNEERRLGATLEDLLAWSRRREQPVEVIVVDDASTDGTAALVTARAATASELRLLRLTHNAGKGGSVRAGMAAARGARRGFADADGAVPFVDMERLEAALDAGADVAVGSRVLDPSLVQALFHRRFFGFFFRTLVRWLLVRTVADTQCGFKLFSAEAATRLFQDQLLPGFAFDVELLGRAERIGLRVAEVPVHWQDRPGSKVRVLRDGLHMARDVVRLRRRLGPWPRG
jgi:dolichyl-phosphate beta-glucosyltransferase